MVRGTAVGSILGVLPGGGAALPPFSAYALEKKIAADPSRFGKGAVEGVAAARSGEQRRRADQLRAHAHARAFRPIH